MFPLISKKSLPMNDFELNVADLYHKTIHLGFNAGHSTFMWLNAKPKVHVYSFDIGKHRYTRPMADVLGKIKCDLGIIDGGHVGNVPLMDFQHFYKMVKPMSKHLVVLDDWPSAHHYSKDIGAMWIGEVQKGRVKTILQCMNIGTRKGMTFGLFIF